MEALHGKAEDYLLAAFGASLALEPINTANLPYYILDRYVLWRGDLLGRVCIFMATRHPAIDWGVSELIRHRDVVRKQWPGDPVVVVLDRLLPRQRKKLVAGGVAFMVPGLQLFIPEMLLEFREGRTPKAAVEESADHFSPTAQLVTLAALLGHPVQEMNATTLAGRLSVAPMSMVRAFDELQAAGIADAQRVGRERRLRLRARGRALWDLVQQRLQSPVRKVRRMEILHPEDFHAPFAGETALGFYSALSAPRVTVYAIAAADWNRQVRQHLVPVLPEWGEGSDFETWSYDPAVLGDDTKVDPLSVYLSVRGHTNERVAQAADELLESMPW